MKTTLRHPAILTLPALLALGGLTQAAPLSTAFTYQGRLTDGGTNAANGSYDLKFTLFDTNSGGTKVAGPRTNPVAVSNGLFTTTLNFGEGVFTGDARWLEISVRTNGGAAFTTLSPRQELTPSPHAFYAVTASNLAGTLPDALLSTNVALRNTDQTFTGTNIFTKMSSFTGKVGIGTNDPQATLDVNGVLKIGQMAEQSLGFNGYVKIGDLIIQWGQETNFWDIWHGATSILTFPTNFPNAVLAVVPVIIYEKPGTPYPFVCTLAVQFPFEKSKVTLVWDESSRNSQNVKAGYIAIGH